MTLRIHILVATVLLVALVSFGTLLSPPFTRLREALGLPELLPGSRFDGVSYHVVHPDPELARWFHARVIHYYHALFSLLLYATLIALVVRYRIPGYNMVLLLAGLGAILTTLGGLMYGYFSRVFYWHGVFIAGLAMLFASGVVALANFKPRDMLDRALWISGLLLLIGGVIGGYVGSSYMDDVVREEYLNVNEATRFDPGLGESNEIWRAKTGHLHAMVAVALTIAFIAALKFTGVREHRFRRYAEISLLAGVTVMALAAYAVWFVGGVAHVIITPAALLLIASTLALSFLAETGDKLTPKWALAWGLRIGNIAMWLLVAIPGALVAMSLRKPLIFNPAFRDPSWDLAELAYNIGHWHILVLAWGVTLVLIALNMINWKPLLQALLGLVAVVGFLGASIGFNLYVFTAKPGYLNPYDNIWVKALIEPSLALTSIPVAAVAVLLVLGASRREMLRIED